MMFFSVFLQWLKRVDDPKFMSNNTIVISKQPFIILKSSEIGSGSDGAYLNKFVIHHVTEADGGMYICLAANTMGFSWRSAHLIVRSSKSQTLNPHPFHPYHPTTPPPRPHFIMLTSMLQYDQTFIFSPSFVQ